MAAGPYDDPQLALALTKANEAAALIRQDSASGIGGVPVQVTSGIYAQLRRELVYLRRRAIQGDQAAMKVLQTYDADTRFYEEMQKRGYWK
jgi:hypothetical protein